MTHSPDHDSRVLPAGPAERVLARAAELDAVRGAGLSVAHWRAVAHEAGISADAFEAALRETAPVAVTPAPRAPWLVRVSLFGVPSRRAAMGYYAFFAAVLCATFVAVVGAGVLAPTLLAEHAELLLFLALWALFALWSTSRAVRWADRHGWDALP